MNALRIQSVFIDYTSLFRNPKKIIFVLSNNTCATMTADTLLILLEGGFPLTSAN